MSYPRPSRKAGIRDDIHTDLKKEKKDHFFVSLTRTFAPRTLLTYSNTVK
jgi:hypothetical protein